jgi:hypothetical protein
MEQTEAAKRKVVNLLQKEWWNKQVKVYIFSHGVGLVYRGYLDFAYDERQVEKPSPLGSFGDPLLPDFAVLYQEESNGIRTIEEVPIVVIKLDDFQSFEIIQHDSRQLVSLRNKEAGVLIERV